MQLVKSITLKKINCLGIKTWAAVLVILLLQTDGLAQENSPYSRYGLGDLVPNTNVLTRAIGGVSAGFTDIGSVNFTNPASYASFLTYKEPKFKKPLYSRVVLDIGVNYDNRTLREPGNTSKFVANNAQFSYLQLGLPVKDNLGIVFGLRPVSSISYKILSKGRLPGIDSVHTEYSGDGGAFLPTVGAGYSFKKKFSVGFNLGYLFGKKETTTKRALINDTVAYNSSNHTTSTSFGGLFFNAGLQYKAEINKTQTITFGAFGNLKRNINASQDIIRETFVRDATSGDFTQDSVSYQLGVEGKITYPTSFGGGFVFNSDADPDKKRAGSWLIGVDFLQSQWSQFRYYNAKDAVENNWELRTGVQIIPRIPGVTVAGVATKRSGYWSYVAYRAGFMVGKDYVNTGRKLPLLGFSLGMGLPLLNYNAAARGQATNINLAFEYAKRGNDQNLLKENLFRLSLGFSLTDLWFAKRKYD